MINKENLYLYKLARWIGSTNAKDIGVLYIIFGIFSAIVGTTLSLIIRSELAVPGMHIIQNDKYGHIFNVIITAHAIMMIFFFVMPVAIGGFGDFHIRFNKFFYKFTSLLFIPFSYTYNIFKGFHTNYPDHNNNHHFKGQLGPYLAGLIEGDGCITICEKKTGKLYNPKIKIVFIKMI